MPRNYHGQLLGRLRAEQALRPSPPRRHTYLPTAPWHPIPRALIGLKVLKTSGRCRRHHDPSVVGTRPSTCTADPATPWPSRSTPRRHEGAASGSSPRDLSLKPRSARAGANGTARLRSARRALVHFGVVAHERLVANAIVGSATLIWVKAVVSGGVSQATSPQDRAFANARTARKNGNHRWTARCDRCGNRTVVAQPSRPRA